ncbi:AAA family ATPase [Brachyspira hyodysenteriae]|uniref:AAA family ATPase n=1 Tax=Brachyspira hyodysenteriae TaxID=159 RepID=UPI0022CE2C6C|nr:AAA family ATPase [Brachyspira hyodysenteriae]MCZ9889159.1 AAA family ATPase [Brachyspira hyodysenteriae]
MSDKNKISIFVYVSILINLIVLALFITFVFGLKKDAFDVDTKKLDRNALICQNSIVNLVKDYDERLNKIVDSYPFINLLQQVILNGIDTAERDRIISIFRSGNYPFDTVALYLADGKSVFSSPVKTKPVDLESYKNSKAVAFFDKDYDGVYFVKPIKNDRGIEVGYIVASVFKKIFENTSYNLNFVVLSNGVVYYNPSIDINSISIDSLTQYMNKDIGSSGTIDADNNTFAFYSGKVKDIDNFSIGILELNVPIVQKYLKYIILALLSLSFIFLLTTSLVERFKPAANNNITEESEEDDIYDESEPPINNYDNANIVNDEEFNIDDYDNDIEGLDDESIKYLNKVDKITKNSKLDLPNIDEIEDIKVEDNDTRLNDVMDYEDNDDEIIKLDDVLEDGGETIQDDNDEDEEIKIEDLSSLDKVLENEDNDEDESIKLENIENLDDVLDEQQDELEDVPNIDDVLDEQKDELEDIPSLDDIVDEDNEENNTEDVPNLDDVLDEQKDELEDIPSLDDVLNDDNTEDVPNLDDVLDEQEDELEDVPNLDDVLDEEEKENNTEDNSNESMPEMKEYSDEELLDSNLLLDDDEDNNIDDTVGDLNDIPDLHDEIKEPEEDKEDNKDMLEMKEYSDEELLDSNHLLDDDEDNNEEDNNIDDTVGDLDDIPDLDDVIDNIIEENDNTENSNEENEESDENIPEMKEYSDEELLDSNHLLDDDEDNNEEDNNIDDTVGDLDDIPDLDDVIDDITEENDNTENSNEENEESDENIPEMKEYSDEELLDSNHLLDDDEDNNEEDNNIDDTVGDLDDIPDLDDVIDDITEENDNTENSNEENEESDENMPEMREYSDEELLDSDHLVDDDNEEDLNDIPDTNDEVKESEEADNEELEETIDDNNNSSDNDIIKGIDDIIDDNDDNKEGDILISHGSILEDEIVKKEEEYFSSSDAFNFSLNRDFLLGDYDDEENDSNNNGSSNISPNFNEEYDDGEVIKPASEKDSFDTEDLIDKDLYDPEEVPKVPDDFYREAEEKVKENMTSNWKKVLKALRGKKFVNKNMSEMLEWVKEQSGLDIIHAAMLTRQDNGSYDIAESQNISDNTKNKLNISENEALFKKILSHKKTLYVSDPFASDSIKSKFDSKDRKDISHMIFVPIENDEGGLKSFFIGLSSN